MTVRTTNFIFVYILQWEGTFPKKYIIPTFFQSSLMGGPNISIQEISKHFIFWKSIQFKTFGTQSITLSSKSRVLNVLSSASLFSMSFVLNVPIGTTKISLPIVGKSVFASGNRFFEAQLS